MYIAWNILLGYYFTFSIWVKEILANIKPLQILQTCERNINNQRQDCLKSKVGHEKHFSNQFCKPFSRRQLHFVTSDKMVTCDLFATNATSYRHNIYSIILTKNGRGIKEWIQNKREINWYPTIKLWNFKAIKFNTLTCNISKNI